MFASSSIQTRPLPAGLFFPQARGGLSVLGCIDQSDHAGIVADMAARLAQLLSARFTLLQCVETEGAYRTLPDPIDSMFVKRQSENRWHRMIAKNPRLGAAGALELAEGDLAHEICRRVASPDTVLVIGSGADRMGRAIRDIVPMAVLERMAGSVLLVPPMAGRDRQAITQIVLLLDCSSFAEAALNTAARIAREAKADIVLLHVVPDPELTVTGPLGSADIKLRNDLQARNRDIAMHYLEQQKQRLESQGLNVTTICKCGHVRETLSRTIDDLNGDLIILSNRGQGMQHDADIPFGSVATYLLSHVTIPTLMVRSFQAGHLPDRYDRSLTS